MRFPRLSAKCRAAWCAGAAVLLFAQAASAQNAAFKLGSPYNGVPAVFNAQAATPADWIVFYDLPLAGRYAAVTGTPDGFLDLIATVSGAPIPAAGYGVILSSLPAVAGGGTGFRFDPDTAAPPASNLTAVKNPSVTQNPNFVDPTGAVFADPNVPGMADQGRTVGIAGIYATPNADTPVANNNGLASIPVDIDAGLTSPTTRVKNYDINFSLDNEFTGFVNTAGALLTNGATFPHAAGHVQIRQSRRGDLNGDGLVNNFDIQGFVGSIINLNGYQAANPWLRVPYISDTNDDGLTNNFDIQSFVAAIIAGSPEPGVGSPSTVPEPSGVILASIALLASVSVTWYRRRRSA